MNALATSSSPPRVLLIEDDEDLAFGVQSLLSANGRFSTAHAATADQARRALRGCGFDAIVADLSLPDADGLGLIEEISAAYPGVGLLCLTGRDEASAAVRAMHAGASYYLTKPTSGATLLRALDDLVARRTALVGSQQAPGPIGEAPAWRSAMTLLARVARSPRTTVLLTGEPGVGKEEAAALLHRQSDRQRKPFVTVNAACLSPSLVESELFGHEAGAFTGASRQRRGLLEQADGGTLFLDEIGELPLELQPKLLRLLEGQPFRRVGGERLVTVDVRLVAATNRDLGERVRAGAFRADLYERLRVFEIPLPPLRERPGDVALLARHFVARLGRSEGSPPTLSPDALAALEAHSFPGNVRELRNAIERAMVMADGVIERHHLPPDLLPARVSPSAPDLGGLEQLEDIVRAHILRVYERHNRNVTRAAVALGLSRFALRTRLQSYGVLQKKDALATI